MRSLSAIYCLRKAIWLIVLATVVAGCSSKDIDPDDVVAELQDFQSSLKLRRAWRVRIGGDNEKLRLGLRPATDGARIYAAAHDGRIIAVDPESGKRLWRSNTKLPLSGGPATNGEIVVAGSSDGDLIALLADTGTELWRITVTSEVLTAPVVAFDRTIVHTVNGKLTAYSNIDGEQLWSIQQTMPRLQVRGSSAPVLVRNLVVCGFDNGRVVAFDIEDGSIVWDQLIELPSGRSEIERLSDINSAVVVAGNDVYTVGYQGRLAALALESGQVIWARDLSSYTGLSLDISSIYVTDQRSELVSLSRGSGRELWRKKELRNRDVTAPMVFGSSVVVGDFEGYLHWFDIETGDLQARVRAGSERISSQPLALNDKLYVNSDNGSLYAYMVKAPKKR